MDDLRLGRDLRALEEPVVADAAFLDALFDRLVEEAGFRPAGKTTDPVADRQPRASGRATAMQRWRRWLPPVLAAGLLIGGGILVAGSVSAASSIAARARPRALRTSVSWSRRPRSARFIGAPVTLESAKEYTSTEPPLVGRSCGYSYPPGDGSLVVRNVETGISRSPDPAAAWAEVSTGGGGSRVEGVGDAATLNRSPPFVTLYVLKGPYVISVFNLNGGGQNIPQRTMEDIARLIVARL